MTNPIHDRDEALKIPTLTADEKICITLRMRHAHEFDSAYALLWPICQKLKNGIALRDDEFIPAEHCVRSYAIVRDMAALYPVFQRAPNKHYMSQHLGLAQLDARVRQAQQLVMYFERDISKTSGLKLFGRKTEDINVLDVFEQIQAMTIGAKPDSPHPR